MMIPQPYQLSPPEGSDPADEWYRLGFSAHMGNRLGEAQGNYMQALRLNPRHSLATMNLAIVFAQSPGFLNEAMLTMERAAMMDPERPTIWTNWALMSLQSEHMGLAVDAARKAVELATAAVAKFSSDTTRANLENARWASAMVLASAGKAGEAVAVYDDMIVANPKHPAASPNRCFNQTLVDLTVADLLATRKAWWQSNHHPGSGREHHHLSLNGKPMRIGYVGGDFKQHSAAMIFAGAVLNHSPAVEVYLYSSLPTDPNDGYTKRFREKAGPRWRDIFYTQEKIIELMTKEQLSGDQVGQRCDEEAEYTIRKDKIDILVDLAGHTNGGRLGLFTRRPAPVQVTAWGFAHGTGCPEIDWFLADRVAVPEEDREHFAEKIWDLPSIVTYDPPVWYDLKGTSTLPYHANECITYGSYSRYEKLSDQCLATFAAILHKVPDSRLQFKDNGFRRPYSIKRVLAAMDGIDPKRLLFSVNTDHRDHLLAYQQADIMLDPFPHGGGVVTLEELYMGVPVVTLYGRQPSGRTASSVLTQLGMADWIARTPDEYVEIAAAKAADIVTLGKLRKTLRKTFLESPVIAGYVGKVEEAYRGMVQAKREGTPSSREGTPSSREGTPSKVEA